jgi:hypothetical protein
VLPGSLMWNKLVRRRKKRARSAGVGDS